MSIICGYDEPTVDFPDLGLTCCYGTVMGGPGGCTCWRPVYDGDQADPDETTERTVRPSMCSDCAYRPGSPEKASDPDYRGDPETLEELAATGTPFHCHDGLRSIVRWEHPSGAVLPAPPGAYAPPIVGNMPVKLDGQPALLCAGWNARRRALAAKESA